MTERDISFVRLSKHPGITSTIARCDWLYFRRWEFLYYSPAYEASEVADEAPQDQSKR